MVWNIGLRGWRGCCKVRATGNIRWNRFNLVGGGNSDIGIWPMSKLGGGSFLVGECYSPSKKGCDKISIIKILL